MQNPRRRVEQDDEPQSEPGESPLADAQERDQMPVDLWIDRDYPIHPGIPDA